MASHRSKLQKQRKRGDLKFQEALLRAFHKMSLDPYDGSISLREVNRYLGLFPEEYAQFMFENLRILQFNGLIQIGEVADLRALKGLSVTDKGLNYFVEKRKERRKGIVNWSMNIFLVILSAVLGCALSVWLWRLFPEMFTSGNIAP